ncbi:hypothetical protein CJA_2202 [Cellvibrio japonicus Ueda107]|uniref:Uncharacterized protein n=1 Tax=Cellvibrio japonicus (strain Ueda107) TaxID=498211 RepID=B3PJ89_CELJU|nr:hypothetical protein CJA_2202 [Cellvibrio japonicus Ueda107]
MYDKTVIVQIYEKLAANTATTTPIYLLTNT